MWELEVLTLLHLSKTPDPQLPGPSASLVDMEEIPENTEGDLDNP
jgi:hypothetical protein